MQLQTPFIYMISGRLLSLVVMAVGYAALARLLEPSDFGRYAILIAIYSMAEIITQFGLRQRIVSNRLDPHRTEIAAAAGLSLLIAVSLCMVGLAGAMLLPDSILSPQVALTLAPLFLALLVSPFTLGTEVLLHRSVQFGLVSLTSVLRITIEVGTSILLALAGYGTAALAWGFFTAHLTTGLVLIFAGGTERYILPRPGAWRGLFRWGQRMTLIQVLPKLFDSVVLGTLSVMQGTAAVGYFNRAQTIHQLLDRTLLEGIQPVILPVFSQLLRDGTDPAHLYRMKLDWMAAVCWPGFAVIALLAGPLVNVLLGPGWDQVIPTVQILALMGLAFPITKMSQKLFVAIDETALFLRIEIIRETIRLPLALIGASISLEVFAVAYVAGNLSKAFGIVRALHTRIGGPEGGYLPVAARSAILTLMTLLGPVAVQFTGVSSLPNLSIAIPLAISGWLIGLALTRHPMWPYVTMLLHACRSFWQLRIKRRS